MGSGMARAGLGAGLVLKFQTNLQKWRLQLSKSWLKSLNDNLIPPFAPVVRNMKTISMALVWKKTSVTCIWLVVLLLWLLPVLAGCGTKAQAKVFNVREFGATGDGTTSDTKAIQGALDACGQAG